MTISDLYQLMSPASYIAMALVLLFLARSRPEMRSALWFSCTYILAACGFSLTFLQGYFSHGVFVTIATSIYFGATVLLTIGLIKRSGQALPARYLGTVIVVGVAILTYFQIIRPHLQSAQISTAFITTLLILSGCFIASRSRSNRISKTVLFTHTLFGLSFLGPVAIILGFGGLTNVLATPELRSLFNLDRLLSDALALICGFTVTIAYVIDLLTMTRHDADTDSLTGLLNRRAFGQAAEELNATTEASTEGLFIILADLDHFKRVNDQYGHLAGDDLIREVAHVFKKTCTRDAVIARIGGEEFIVAIKADSLVSARKLANNLCVAVQAIELDTNEGMKSFTVSLGVAQHTLAETLLQTRDRADQALYMAKTSGRNCVVTQEDLAIARLKRHLDEHQPSDIPLQDRA